MTAPTISSVPTFGEVRAEHVSGHKPDLEREQNIMLLKTIRAQMVACIELTQRYDMNLAYELGTARAKIDERLSHLLLARELADR